jgi:hypothetical protein
MITDGTACPVEHKTIEVRDSQRKGLLKTSHLAVRWVYNNFLGTDSDHTAIVGFGDKS